MLITLILMRNYFILTFLKNWILLKLRIYRETVEKDKYISSGFVPDLYIRLEYAAATL